MRLLIQQASWCCRLEPGRLGSPGEGSQYPIIDQFSLSVRAGPGQRSGGDSPGGCDGWPAALSKAFWHPWAWLALCLRLGRPLPFPSPPVCGVSSKAMPLRKPTAVVATRWSVQGCGHCFGLGAWVQPRCQISWPLPCSPRRFRVGTREAEVTQCSQGFRAVLGEPGLGQRCPPHLLLFPRLPESRAWPGRVPACSPQHVCSGNARLIKEWDGGDPTLTTHQQQLHTHALEEGAGSAPARQQTQASCPERLPCGLAVPQRQGRQSGSTAQWPQWGWP